MKINNFMNKGKRIHHFFAAAVVLTGALFCASAEDISLSRYLELVENGNIDIKLAHKDADNAKQQENQNSNANDKD